MTCNKSIILFCEITDTRAELKKKAELDKLKVKIDLTVKFQRKKPLDGNVYNFAKTIGSILLSKRKIILELRLQSFDCR